MAFFSFSMVRIPLRTNQLSTMLFRPIILFWLITTLLNGFSQADPTDISRVDLNICYNRYGGVGTRDLPGLHGRTVATSSIIADIPDYYFVNPRTYALRKRAPVDVESTSKQNEWLDKWASQIPNIPQPRSQGESTSSLDQALEGLRNYMKTRNVRDVTASDFMLNVFSERGNELRSKRKLSVSMTRNSRRLSSGYTTEFDKEVDVLESNSATDFKNIQILRPVFRQLGVEIAESSFLQFKVQSTSWGLPFMVTWIEPKQGVMVVREFVPAMNQQIESGGKKNSNENWLPNSEVLYQLWKQNARRDFNAPLKPSQNLRHIIYQEIRPYAYISSIFRRIFVDMRGSAPLNSPLEIRKTDMGMARYFDALKGSSEGELVQQMLLDHKLYLGQLEIIAFTIWHYTAIDGYSGSHQFGRQVNNLEYDPLVEIEERWQFAITLGKVRERRGSTSSEGSDLSRRSSLLRRLSWKGQDRDE